MNLLRNLHILGKNSRGRFAEDSALVISILQELNQETTAATLRHIGREQYNLLGKIEAEINSGANPKTLLTLMQQADNLHLVLHGLLSLETGLGRISPAATRLVSGQFYQIVQTVRQGGITFQALLEDFSPIIRLTSNPAGCYLDLSGGTDKASGATKCPSMVIIQDYLQSLAAEAKKLDLEIAPSRSLQRSSEGGFDMSIKNINSA